MKYIGIFIDSHLNWSHHTNIIASKLSRAIGMLSKIRHYVSDSTLRSIYFGIFSSILTYGCQIWGQIQNKHINRIIKLQDKAVRVINYAHFYESRNPLYVKSKILKFNDNIKLLNFLYVHDNIKGNLPTVLLDSFKPVHNIHNYNTRGAFQNLISLPKINTQVYGLKSVKYQSSKIWNTTVNKYSNTELPTKSRAYCKRFITNIFVQGYQT